jgi:hypothetical protein
VRFGAIPIQLEYLEAAYIGVVRKNFIEKHMLSLCTFQTVTNGKELTSLGQWGFSERLELSHALTYGLMSARGPDSDRHLWEFRTKEDQVECFKNVKRGILTFHVIIFTVLWRVDFESVWEPAGVLCS